MVEIIADITQNSKLDASAVNREKDVILREMEEVNKDIVEMIFDQLHAVAFEGQFILRGRWDVLIWTRSTARQHHPWTRGAYPWHD
jgi:hypothetical protein